VLEVLKRDKRKKAYIKGPEELKGKLLSASAIEKGGTANKKSGTRNPRQKSHQKTSAPQVGKGGGGVKKKGILQKRTFGDNLKKTN